MLLDALGDAAAPSAGYAAAAVADDDAVVAVGDAATDGLAVVVGIGLSAAADDADDGDVVTVGVPQAAIAAIATAKTNDRTNLWFMRVRSLCNR
jgi:hypothetical protein